ncbi:MAG: DUF1552 domain-containing protein [Planctomycetota bacterium]
MIDSPHSAKKHPLESARLSRRTVLRSGTIALGLPLLEAMTPASKSVYAAATSDEVKKSVRMACVFVPNGVIQDSWQPTGQERDWNLSKTLEPLAGVKQDINVIEGLAHDNGRSKKDGAGDHARSCATFLTSARPVKTSSNIRLGISVDQVAASALVDQCSLPSIELGLLGSRNAGSCDSGYSCAYSSNISWRSESQPMPKETVPRMAFERMFGTGDAAQQRRQRMLRQSILDLVREDTKRLLGRVGATDQRKLDEYFTSVREIERRIERVEQEDRASLPDIDIPYGRVEAFREHARLMFDLMVVGFQTETTRVATLMLDNAGGNRQYKEVGVNDAHHGLSHHRNKVDSVEKLRKIDHYLVEQFAYFVEKLKATPDGDGTLLDNSMVLYGSGLGDGNRHTHHDLPVILAGSAAGQIETGRYLRTEQETPMANLYLSMLDAMGTPAESFGDSTGPLAVLSS